MRSADRPKAQLSALQPATVRSDQSRTDEERRLRRLEPDFQLEVHALGTPSRVRQLVEPDDAVFLVRFMQQRTQQRAAIGHIVAGHTQRLRTCWQIVRRLVEAQDVRRRVAAGTAAANAHPMVVLVSRAGESHEPLTLRARTVDARRRVGSVMPRDQTIEEQLRGHAGR